MHRLLYFFLLALMFAVLPGVVSTGDVHAASSHQGEQAPDFQLPDIEGVVHHLADYRGKVVILNFWASWCPECEHEMPSLIAFSERFKNDNLAVIGITIDYKQDEIKKITSTSPITVLLDAEGDVFVKKYTVTRLPQTLIIDRDGVIVERLFGRQEFTSKAFVKKIKKLLSGGKKQI